MAKLPREDLSAIADYLLSIQKLEPAIHSQSIRSTTEPGGYIHGGEIFIGACGSCHETTAPMMSVNNRPTLAQSTAINADDPRDAIQTILGGIAWPEEPRRAIYMPPFEHVLSDQDLADLAQYLRARFTSKPVWSDISKTIAAVHQARGTS
jgi:mono/diheme cytochrome c family protein